MLKHTVLGPLNSSKENMYVSVSMNSVNSVKSLNINYSQKGLQQRPDTNPPLGGRFARLGAVALNSSRVAT